jgi:hypothetical protein
MPFQLPALFHSEHSLHQAQTQDCKYSPSSHFKASLYLTDAAGAPRCFTSSESFGKVRVLHFLLYTSKALETQHVHAHKHRAIIPKDAPLPGQLAFRPPSFHSKRKVLLALLRQHRLSTRMSLTVSTPSEKNARKALQQAKIKISKPLISVGSIAAFTGPVPCPTISTGTW